MWKTARFTKQKLAREQNLERWKRLQEARVKKQTEAIQQTSQPAPASAALVNASASTVPQYPRYGKAEVALYKEGEKAKLYPGEALRRLVDIYLEAAAAGSANLVLLWPGALRTLPLTHVFATFEHWAEGNKKGLRGLFYPAKSNTFFSFNHLFLDHESLLRWARELYESPREKNPAVKESFPEKDAVLFRIGNTKELQPCINELIPHFDKLIPEQRWQHYDDELLDHVMTKLRRRTEKQALRANLEVLGNPKTAPDALFAIGYRLNKGEIRDALALLKKFGLPKVVLADATRPVRMSIEGWRSRISSFVEAFVNVFKAERPGLVLVTDDPGICYQLRKQLEKRTQKALADKASTNLLHLRIQPVVCSGNGEGLRPEGEPEPPAPEPRKFRLEVRDPEASKVIGRLYKTLNTLSLGQEAGKPIRAAADYLQKLSALPSSLTVLNRWLDERQADTRFREQFVWPAYRGSLMQFIGQGHAGAQRGELEKMIELADKLYRDYERGTAVALKMAAEVGVAAHSSKHIAVVFTRPMVRMLAERFLADYEFEDSKRLADFQERVQLLLTSQLREHLATNWARRYVFVGIDDEALRLLVTDNRIPANSVVLLTYRAGIYLRWALKPIFEFEEFKRFKPRIEMLLGQLTEQLGVDERSVLSVDDFVLPLFNFNVSSTSSESDVDEAHAWRIEVDDMRVLFRGETSVVYVYDPAKEDAGLTGFRSVEVQSLKEGDQLFVMSEDLHEMVEDYLKQAGVSVSRDKPFEATLRQYHELVMRKLSERFPAPTRTAQVCAIREHIVQHHPDIKDLPANIGHWVNLGESPNTPFEELTPQAPRKFRHFQAFAEALGFEPTQVIWFWQCAIHPIRVNRQIDGRYISDLYSKVLFDPESAIVHAGLSRKATTALYEKARENVHVVVYVRAPGTKNKE